MAAPSAEKEKSKGGGRAESLGWLTESTVMPKKHKAIEGVGAASIVELKAQLYRTQEEVRKAKDSSDPSSSSSAASAADAYPPGREPPLPPISSPTRTPASTPALTSTLLLLLLLLLHLPLFLFLLYFCYPGRKSVLLKSTVSLIHATRDKLELKAIKDGSVSYAALEKKAALYDKLSRGELPDEEENEKYCVDFFQKSMTNDQSQPSNSQHNGLGRGVDFPFRDGDGDGDGDENGNGNGNGDDASDAFLSSKPFGLGRTGSTVDRDEHKRFVREVHEEVNQAREKASSIKMRRQEQEAARREKLRQAYLKKQLDKLLSSKQTAANDTGSSAG